MRMPPFYNRWNAYLEHRTIGSSISLEASSICQLNCVKCGKNTNELFTSVIGQGVLSFENFVNVVDANPWIKHIELSNKGEIFLNNQLEKMMEYAYSRSITLTAYNGVNLNTLSDDMAEALVKHKFSNLVVSIDGSSEETYGVYQKKGSFKAVIDNIKKINFYKQKYSSNAPSLEWQFVVFGHNEHELPVARNMAKALNMSFHPAVNNCPSYSPIRDSTFVMQYTGWGTEKDHYCCDSIPCYQLWSRPQINWDGKLLGCCGNIVGNFGNVFEQGLSHCLRSKNYIYAKEMVLGKKPKKEGIPCAKCPFFERRDHPLRGGIFHITRIIDRIS